MSDILIRGADTAPEMAHALAEAVGGGMRTIPANVSDDEFLEQLAAPEVILGIVALDGEGWGIARQATKPVVVVPAAARPITTIHQVLVPLDGTDETVSAVAETVRLFGAAGTKIVVLHVFDAATTPEFWDQAAHARPVWEQEFRARYCTPHFPETTPTLTLRSGAPGEHVIDLAAQYTDLIILGWSRRLDPGRAQTVRRTVGEAPVPVMLIPVGAIGRSPWAD